MVLNLTYFKAYRFSELAENEQFVDYRRFLLQQWEDLF